MNLSSRKAIAGSRGSKVGANSRPKHTMHDVARLAEVSIATVSALINGAPKVSEARAERIRHAMAALDYHPDQIARSLKVGRTQTIGVVIPDITNPFYPTVFRGIEDAARSAGYGVVLCNSNESAEQERAHLTMLLARRVDGVLLACSSGSTAYEASGGRRSPLVFVDRLPPEISVGAISSDNVGAGRTAAEHLIELGHRRIALLAGDVSLSPHADRLAGFRQAMHRAGLPVLDRYLCVGGTGIEDGRTASETLLRLARAPTAIIATNSKLLLGLLHAARKERITVPRDLSVLTFDENEWSEYLDPPITAMVQSTYEIGQRAFELLRARIAPNSETAAAGVVRLEVKLHVRGSTGRFKAR
jgi:LacI family transcriptional regulator